MADDALVGIDLGTTNSAIAWMTPDGIPEVLPNAEGQRITPSVVQVRTDGSTLVGDLAKREIALEKENTAQFFKRDMGTASTYEYSGRAWTPTDLSAEVLKKLKTDAEAALGRDVRRAIITVPAYFQDAARIATLKAGQQANLEVLQIINEPTAAALTYAWKKARQEEMILVYDLGGGTFDITLARITPDGTTVIGTDGNHHLGGKDWDDRLFEYVCEQFRMRHGIDPLDDAYTFQEILARTEDAKKTLSVNRKAVVPINCQGIVDRIEVGRDTFQDITRDLLAQTETLMAQVLSDTGFDYQTISGVLMVGGSTRMPACIDLVRRLSGRDPITTVNPDECVALGAAIQGYVLQYPDKGASVRGGLAWRPRVQDVMSHSMGMIAIGASGEHYINSVLIPKNKPIPCREVRPYQVHTQEHRDNSTSIYVTQGESDDPVNCSFVGKYVVKGIPHGKGGVAVLDIAYEYDRSGVVTVSAVERRQGRTLSIDKEAIPQDMAWVSKSPRELSTISHRTIYAAVDLSGSMSDQPLLDAKRAVADFIDKSDLAHTSIGIMCFADSVHVDQVAIQDAKKLKQAVEGWTIGSVGICNSAHPFDEARALLGTDGKRYLIVLTDGIWSGRSLAEARAKECRNAGIDIIALGFGSADDAFLRSIATAEQSVLLSSSGDLVAALGEIAQEMVEDQPAGPTGGLHWKPKGR
jgi:molecular chaperone DnaK (HSP70)